MWSNIQGMEKIMETFVIINLIWIWATIFL